LNFRLFVLIILISQSIFSQKKERSRDFFSSKQDSVSSVEELDTSVILFEEALEEPCTNCPGGEVDSSSLSNENEVSNVNFVPEFIIEDSTLLVSALDTSILYDTAYWVGIDSNYSVLDMYNVNPYHIDGLSLTDTFIIALFDSVRFWSMPLDSGTYLTSKFGPRGYRYHYGDDLKLQIGDSVRATFDGVVRISKYNKGGYGNYVLIRHDNGLETIYGHLSERFGVVGKRVKAGDCIGLGGNTGRSTGAHLHFEIRYKGNAIDPKEVFSYKEHKLKNGDALMMMPKLFHYIAVQRQKVYHTIRSGDTLYGIARRYHVRSSQICRLNRISTKTTLRIGRRLRIK